MKNVALFRNPWWVVLGCLLGYTVSPVSIIYTFSLFIAPLTAAFGWSRATLSGGLSIALLMTALFCPLAGWLLDRFGIKRVTLVMLLCYALSTAALALTGPNPLSFYVLFAIVGVFGAGTSLGPYGKTISGWFDENRGIALAITLSGTGISIAAAPQYVHFLIENSGWRTAYLGMGAAILALGFLGVLIFVRNPPGAGAEDESATAIAALPGLTVAEAVRTPTFWLIAVVIVTVTMTLAAFAAHAIPLMTSRGISRGAAVGMLTWLGLTAIVARLISGFLVDHIHAKYVAALAFGIQLIGVGALIAGATGTTLLFTVVCMGIASGAEIEVLGYFPGRYFGLRHYGAIFGWFFTIYGLSNALGPLLMGAAFDATHSYDRALWVLAGGLVVAIATLLCLGPFAFGAQRDASASRLVPAAR